MRAAAASQTLPNSAPRGCSRLPEAAHPAVDRGWARRGSARELGHSVLLCALAVHVSPLGIALHSAAREAEAAVAGCMQGCDGFSCSSLLPDGSCGAQQQQQEACRSILPPIGGGGGKALPASPQRAP